MTTATTARRTETPELDAFRRALDRAVHAVATEAQGRIHPDLLRMPLVVWSLSNAALVAVGEAQLHTFLTFCVRAGLQPGKDVEAVIVKDDATGLLQLQPRITFATTKDAEDVRLPGEPTDFDGMGGQPIGFCPDALLRGVEAWITRPDRPNRRTTYARLAAAITHVLTARRAAATTEDLA